MTTPTAEDWTWLARIRKPQGRKGELLAEILTDFPQLFADRTSLTLISPPETPASKSIPPRPITLINHWLHKGAIVLHFDGINSINDAETLTGLIVAIPREQRAPLASDEIYVGDLIDCELIDCAGPTPRILGIIKNVDRTAGPVALLVVQPHPDSAQKSDEILIPFAKAFLKSIDLTTKKVEMTLPEGLVEINSSN